MGTFPCICSEKHQSNNILQVNDNSLIVDVFRQAFYTLIVNEHTYAVCHLIIRLFTVLKIA